MRLSLLLLPLCLLVACDNDQKTSELDSCELASIKTVSIPAGDILLGSKSGYPEESPRLATVSEFDIDITEVTNDQFRQFVTETGYVTTAEKPQPGTGKVGGAVFKQPTAKNPNWWQFIEGANWKHPEGPNSSIDGRDNYPVVQVSLIDAKAYANWAGRSIPTESQWEFAARAGTESEFVWGDQRAPNGKEQANTWQGAFPIQNSKADGFNLRAPVGCYEPNGFGLYDMIGNVWEWTVSEYEFTRVPNSYTIKGGSFLCAPNYCARYRAPARQPQEVDFSTNHIGFRTVGKPITN